MIIGQILIVILIMLLAPFLFGTCAGILGGKTCSAGMNLVYGWLFLLCAFEMFAVPAAFMKRSLTELCLSFSLFLICAAGFSIFMILRHRNSMKLPLFRPGDIKKAGIYFWAAMALILFQMMAYAFGTHLDSDDAYYIGTAVTSLSTDTLFVFQPDNGIFGYSTPPARYALSAIMLFWAYVSRLSGIHPLIIAHVAAPMILVPISYILLWNIANELFETKEKASLFLLFINVFHMFGFTSVYTQSAFFLLRIWQGKAMLPNIIFPGYLYLLLELRRNPADSRSWSFVFILSVAACCCSSMAVPLCLIALFCGSLLLAFLQKRLQPLIWGGICCIPCLAVGGAYLLLR